jgi:hypothetical protein
VVQEEYRKAVDQRDYNRFLAWLRGQLSNAKQPILFLEAFAQRLQAVKHAFLLPYSMGY